MYLTNVEWCSKPKKACLQLHTFLDAAQKFIKNESEVTKTPIERPKLKMGPRARAVFTFKKG